MSRVGLGDRVVVDNAWTLVGGDDKTIADYERSAIDPCIPRADPNQARQPSPPLHPAA
jgi:hypothetical protein